jgi:uncharacterized Tic20 family protein
MYAKPNFNFARLVGLHKNRAEGAGDHRSRIMNRKNYVSLQHCFALNYHVEFVVFVMTLAAVFSNVIAVSVLECVGFFFFFIFPVCCSTSRLLHCWVLIMREKQCSSET